MAANVEHWVQESRRRGEEVVVLIRNKTTHEVVETKINPVLIAEMTHDYEIRKEDEHAGTR